MAEGKRRDLHGEEGGKGGSAPWQEAPPAVQDPTSAARPVLPNLKAVSAETEGAVSSHDAAIAAPELVAG